MSGDSKAVLSYILLSSNHPMARVFAFLHCRLSVVNDNQTVILLLSLLTFLCVDPEYGFRTVLAQFFSSKYKCRRCTTYSQNHPSSARQQV